MDDLEPLNEEPYSYRKAALGYLQILLAVDAYMARSKDGVIAWVSIAIVLRLHSVKGLTTANIASQLGSTESQLERSCSRFKRLLPADGVPRDFGIPVTATAPTIPRTALNANGFVLP